jgi:hypothetical protein
MPSFTTIYRAAVMLAVGAIVVKGWQLYGPSAEQVKSTFVSAVDMAETALKSREQTNEEVPPVPNSGGAAPRFTITPESKSGDAIAPPLTAQSQPAAITTPADVGPNAAAPTSQEPIAQAPDVKSPAPIGNDDRLPALMSRLEQLGVAEPKLAAWGSSGHLYRFCCRAPVANSPAVTQHFESVAAEPAVAVEQVVAKVEAWRTAQRSNSVLR